jgi:hypothetical protein
MNVTFAYKMRMNGYPNYYLEKLALHTTALVFEHPSVPAWHYAVELEN